MTKVAVLGMGKSGQSATRLALSLGLEVHCLDSNTQAVHIEGSFPHYKQDFDITTIDQLIVSPGVPSHNPFIETALQERIPVCGELGFAAQHIQQPLLAVTGTNGKSSTAFYTHQILQQAGLRSFIGGNFGIALSEMALRPERYDIGVVEVSSYQMEFPHQFAPLAAVALNITPDHLQRHGTMEVYAEMKRRIFQAQREEHFSIVTKGETALYPDSNSRSQRWWINGFPGGVLEQEAIWIQTPKGEHRIPLHNIQLLGEHNRQNLLAAYLLAHSVDIDIHHLDASQIQPLEHRLEHFHTSNGIRWINDSKATNIEATIAGIEGIAEPQIVLLGGAGKQGANYKRLLPSLSKYAQSVICFGRSGSEIHQQLDGNNISLHLCPSLQEASTLAESLASTSTYVVLSPACASFDEFRNFEHRGQVFKQLIQQRKVSS